jgi:hypothetical protein
MGTTLQELAPQASTNQEDDDGGAVVFSIDDPGIYDAEGCIEFIDDGISTCWIPATGRLPQAAESSPSNTAGIEMRRSSGAASIFDATGVDFGFNLRV